MNLKYTIRDALCSNRFQKVENRFAGKKVVAEKGGTLKIILD